MKIFYISTSTPSLHIDYYKVEAMTEKEAIDLIVKGEVEAYDTEFEMNRDEVEIVDVNIEE
jgi:hypothetical protein